MAYGFDLSKMSLERFKAVIKENYLIPSMRILRDGIDEIFGVLSHEGIALVSELEKKIGNQKKADSFAEVTGVDVIYMTALRRLVSSYKPKARKLSEFPDLDAEMLATMAKEGLKTSKTLFEFMANTAPQEIEKRLGLSDAQRRNIGALMEVTQLRYVSPLFATAMVRSGNDSIVAVSKAERQQFLEDLIEVNKTQEIYKGNIGDTDVQFLIDDAKVFLELQD